MIFAVVFGISMRFVKIITLKIFRNTAIFAIGRQFVSAASSGLDGSRTRVQKPIPCPSTSVVHALTFPPRLRHERAAALVAS